MKAGDFESGFVIQGSLGKFAHFSFDELSEKEGRSEEGGRSGSERDNMILVERRVGPVS